MANPRETDGPKEGEPGEIVIVTVTDVLPPAVYTAVVLDDGYFSDELYEEIDDLRRQYRRKALRDEE